MHICNYYCHGDLHVCDLISVVNIDTATPEELEDLKKDLLLIHNRMSRFQATYIEWIRWAEIGSAQDWYESKQGWNGSLRPSQQYCYIFCVKTPGFYGHPLAVLDAKKE